MSKIIIKSTYRWNHQTKFRKLITRGEFVHFRSTIATSRSRTRGIQFIIFNFIKKSFQSLVSEDNFFCWVYDDFCSAFLLYDVIDFVSSSQLRRVLGIHFRTTIVLNLCKWYGADSELWHSTLCWCVRSSFSKYKH